MKGYLLANIAYCKGNGAESDSDNQSLGEGN